MRVRRRAIGGTVLAIALVVAVALLRGQVEPPESDPTAQPMPLTATPSPRTLPFRPAERVTRWRIYQLPAGTVQARADPEYIVMSSVAESALRQPEGVLTVRSRDGSEWESGYRSQRAGWEPVDWQILDGALFVIEVQDEGLDSRLMRVEFGDGRVEEIPVGSVQRLAPTLLTVGDELVGAGISVKNPTERCAITIKPSTGDERIVACGVVLPIIEPADGGVLIKLPDNSPDGCSVRLLIPGRGEFGLPVFVGYCRQRQIIPLDGWQASYLDGTEPAQPLLATNGTDGVVLGMAKVAAVSCHGRLYWVSGGRRDSPYGTEVLRWTPGDREVEVVRRSRGETEFGWPTCVKGTLSVPVYGSAVDGSPLTGLMVLDRP